MTADTYTHVLADDSELDRFGLLARMVHTSVQSPTEENAD